MSNREIVINLIEKLPEDMPLQDIALEIELIAGVITPTVIADLEIVRFIAHDSPEHAGIRRAV